MKVSFSLWNINPVKIYSSHLFPNMSTIKLILLIFCAKASMIDAYRSGAPSQACQSLIPGHGVNPQQTQSPFDIKATLSYNNQQASSINVTISSKYGSESFAGFIMQAVLHSDPSIIVDGTFEYTLSTKTLKCNGRNPVSSKLSFWCGLLVSCFYWPP